MGQQSPRTLPERIEWRFDESQPDWTPGLPWNPTMEPLSLTRTEDALRLTLTEGTRHATGTTVGSLELDVPGLQREDWGSLVVRARSTAELGGFYVAFDRRDGVGTASDFSNPYRHFADSARVTSGKGMALEPGTTLGPYSVIAKIGEGGMGEVYQARDTKLDRNVALKVLPEAFTAERLPLNLIGGQGDREWYESCSR